MLTYMCLGVWGIGKGFGVMAGLIYFDLAYSIVCIPALALLVEISAGIVFTPFHAAVQEKTTVHMMGRVSCVITSIRTTATILLLKYLRWVLGLKEEK
ncbi:hypothetical protein [Bacillus sp. P14.5]|uniref:hypothetical protein n=1 Tax=Bacillus sp. P14.5 TaxID=1983400 RepID=UPI000DEAF44D|nr:hypothetical protein [Bacillus sp. P14.5]